MNETIIESYNIWYEIPQILNIGEYEYHIKYYIKEDLIVFKYVESLGRKKDILEKSYKNIFNDPMCDVLIYRMLEHYKNKVLEYIKEIDKYNMKKYEGYIRLKDAIEKPSIEEISNSFNKNDFRTDENIINYIYNSSPIFDKLPEYIMYDNNKYYLTIEACGDYIIFYYEEETNKYKILDVSYEIKKASYLDIDNMIEEYYNSVNNFIKYIKTNNMTSDSDNIEKTNQLNLENNSDFLIKCINYINEHYSEFDYNKFSNLYKNDRAEYALAEKIKELLFAYKIEDKISYNIDCFESFIYIVLYEIKNNNIIHNKAYKIDSINIDDIITELNNILCYYLDNNNDKDLNNFENELYNLLEKYNISKYKFDNKVSNDNIHKFLVKYLNNVRVFL